MPRPTDVPATAPISPAASPQVRGKIVRVITRLNVGGPSLQAIHLTREFPAKGFPTTLVVGAVAPDEGDMRPLAEDLGVRPRKVGSIRRAVGPRDMVALARLVVLMRRERPDIVHTHTAKAGTLGRAATIAAFPRRRRRPKLVHTFHGQSLTGYFNPTVAEVFRRIERALARRTDTIVTVADEVADDLVRLDVCAREAVTVVPLGFDLAPFVDARQAERRAAARSALAISDDQIVVLLLARLVPIKRVDRFLRMAVEVGRLGRRDIVFLVAGDGELRDDLRASPDAQALGTALRWLGWRLDVAEVLALADIVVQTSDNEGTPVSLIEAHAAGLPVVSTRVGGVAAVVLEGETGFLVDRDDERAFAARVDALAADPELRQAAGAAGQRHVLARFTLRRLVEDLDVVYTDVLGKGS